MGDVTVSPGACHAKISSRFFDLPNRLKALSQHGDPLERLSQAIDWNAFRPTLRAAFKKERKSEAGRKPYDPVMMLKVLILQHLYDLSDHDTQRQILDRLSFMRFLGLALHQDVPDEKTIWLFRDSLGPKGVKRLFIRFDALLERQGLVAEKGQMIDAAIVERPRQKGLSSNEKIRKAARKPDPTKSEAARRQKDLDAEWTKKHKRHYYGYKNHVNADRKHKLIRRYEVTTASVHDGTMLEAVLDPKNTGRSVWGDKAYRSADNAEVLAEKALVNRIHHRAQRNHPLTASQEATNRRRSKVRARVEHVFAGPAQQTQFQWIRCVGLARAATAIGLKNLAYNMMRRVFLLREQTA